MSGWIRVLGFVSVLFMSLYLVHRVWPYVYYREPVRRLDKDVRVVQPEPEDRAAEVLVGFANRLDRTGFGFPHFDGVPLAELRAYCETHADTLADFWRWYDNGGKQALAAQSQAPMAARFHLFELASPYGVDPMVSARRLGRLLLTQAHLDFSAGRLPGGRRALTATFELAHFHLQNADLFLSCMGYVLLNDAQYYLSELAPYEVLTSEWVPYLADRDLLTDVWRKLHWVYSVRLTRFAPYLVRGLNQIEDAPFPVLRRLGGGYHVGHTQNLIYDAHQTFCRDIAGPLNRADFAYHRLAKPVGIFSFNPIGRTFLEMQDLNLKSFIWMDALITARADVLRVRIELADVGLPWEQRHIVEQIEKLSLVNPFSGQAYRVGEDGFVTVLPADDPRWRDIYLADWRFTAVIGPAPGLLVDSLVLSGGPGKLATQL